MKKNVMKSILSIVAFLVSVGIYAQSVSGLVTSEDGPLPGATVLVKGTNDGTTTDFDGNFTIEAGADDVLVVSFVGFVSQEVSVAGQDNLTINLVSDSELEEVIVTGYGSQTEREITSAAVNVKAEDFNQGPINSPAQLLQGKVAGLTVVRPGGNPNETPTIRIRGISSLGANASPLIVVDGVPGSTLDNIDPNDIDSFTVLKDGSGAAIYGSRGSAGVILITTKRGLPGPAQWSYSTQFTSENMFNELPVLSASEFLANGGTDLGTETDWVGEITQPGSSQIHNLAVAGGDGKSSYRVSANVRTGDGILINTGYNQFNTRANFRTKGLKDKLDVTFNVSYTNRTSDLGDEAAFYYATFYNPTAPVFATDPLAKYSVSPTQFGGYFEQEGLYDSFNPVPIAELTQNTGEGSDFNYNLAASYDLTDNFKLNVLAANQRQEYSTKLYRPGTMFYSGDSSTANAGSPTRKGIAQMANGKQTQEVYEVYGTWDIPMGDNNIVLTGGYSYNQFNSEGQGFLAGDFPDAEQNWIDNLAASQDLLNSGRIRMGSSKSPDEKLIAMFARANYTINNNIFINASIRREGSTRLGENEKWGVFPSIGLGADLNDMFGLGYKKLKARFGYATTGALPGTWGLTRQQRAFVWDGGGTSGGNTVLTRAANPDLKWEEKAETNFGIEFETGRLAIDLDIYSRDIKDFIIDREVDVAVYGVGNRTENAGRLKTSGVELNIEYDVINNSNVKYNTGVLLATTKNTLEEYPIDLQQLGYLGAPGQNAVAMIRVKVGESLGNIYGPVFTGTDAAGGNIFEDVNGDGTLNTAAGNILEDDYDGRVLGSGYPDMELGWKNTFEFGNWTVNAFFRGAFGHSLINTFRAFYEPYLPSQSSYNKIDTSLADPNIKTAQYNSLYVEKADFLYLDNLTVSRRFDFGPDSAIKDITVSLNALRPLLFTNYTGTDPTPEYFDAGDNNSADRVEYQQTPSGPWTFRGATRQGAVSSGALLTPGIDRRADYYNTQSFTLGLSVNF